MATSRSACTSVGGFDINGIAAELVGPCSRGLCIQILIKAPAIKCDLVSSYEGAKLHPQRVSNVVMA